MTLLERVEARRTADRAAGVQYPPPSNSQAQQFTRLWITEGEEKMGPGAHR